MHGQLRHAYVARVFHGFHQQRVRLFGGFVRRKIVGGLKVHRIDFFLLHKLKDLHGLGGFWLDFFDLFRLDDHVFAFAEFIALHNLIAFDHLFVHGTIELLLYSGIVRAMKHVERNTRAASAGKQLYRHGNESKSKISSPNRCCHDSPLFKISPNLRVTYLRFTLRKSMISGRVWATLFVASPFSCTMRTAALMPPARYGPADPQGRNALPKSRSFSVSDLLALSFAAAILAVFAWLHHC